MTLKNKIRVHNIVLGILTVDNGRMSPSVVFGIAGGYEEGR
jgi:hypothetical protein